MPPALIVGLHYSSGDWTSTDFSVVPWIFVISFFQCSLMFSLCSDLDVLQAMLSYEGLTAAWANIGGTCTDINHCLTFMTVSLIFSDLSLCHRLFFSRAGLRGVMPANGPAGLLSRCPATSVATHWSDSGEQDYRAAWRHKPELWKRGFFISLLGYF